MRRRARHCFPAAPGKAGRSPFRAESRKDWRGRVRRRFTQGPEGDRLRGAKGGRFDSPLRKVLIMSKTILVSVSFALAALFPGAALAYIGPGVAGGVIATVVGVLGAIFLAIVGVLYYPIKRMLKGRKSAAAEKRGSDGPAE